MGFGSKDTKELHPQGSAPSLWTSTRFAVVIVCFLGGANAYMLRVNISMAIVCMLDRLVPWTGENATEIVNATDGQLYVVLPGDFNWTSDIQGYVLGAFYWGYCVTPLPAGWVSHRFGAKRLIGWCMFASALLTCLNPLAAGMHYSVLITLRVASGLLQGALFCSLQLLYSKWIPPLERSFLIGLANAGMQLGPVIIMVVAGFLCEYLPWSSIFYFGGIHGFLWFLAWMYVVYDSPAEHPRISVDERALIETALRIKATSKKSPRIPWISIMTSGPVWAVFITHFCANWGTQTFLSSIPTFLSEDLKFDMKSNGLLSALPYIGTTVVIFISGYIADTLQAKSLFSTRWCRVFFTMFGEMVPGLFLCIMANTESVPGSVALLILSVSMTGTYYSGGFLVNVQDIASTHSSIIYGISNSLAAIPGFLAPKVTKMITADKQHSSWQIVFYLVAAIFAIGAVSYLFLASGDLQSWAKEEDNLDTDVENVSDMAESPNKVDKDKAYLESGEDMV